MSQKLKKMPKHLQKSLQEYLSKIKKPSSNIQRLSSKNWIPSRCKHTRTVSIPDDSNRNNDRSSSSNNNKDCDNSNHNNGAATLSDIDRFLYENFKSLYIQDDDDNKTGREIEEGDEENGESDDQEKRPKGIFFKESPRFIVSPPNLRGSHRFFATPVTSGSLIDEAQTSLTVSSEDVGSSSTSTSTTNKILTHDSPTSSCNDSKDVTLSHGCIAILKSSPCPCDDFRRSMQEMATARLQHHAKVDWDFMEQLLFSYLNLNEKKSHKFILRAFVDLVVELRQDSNKIPARSARHFPVGRSERRRRTRHVT